MLLYCAAKGPEPRRQHTLDYDVYARRSSGERKFYCSDVGDRNYPVIYLPDEAGTLEFRTMKPFYVQYVDEPGRSRCGVRWATVGFADDPESKIQVACVLVTDSYQESLGCDYEDILNEGFSENGWVLAARLWGYRQSETSLGNVFAFSYKGCRIAMADWNRILVWPLNPKGLVECVDVREEEYYYTRSPNTGMVELMPIVLESEGVVFKMHFNQEDEDMLYALTDRGLMCWELGPSCRGRRRVEKLDPRGKIARYQRGSEDEFQHELMLSDRTLDKRGKNNHGHKTEMGSDHTSPHTLAFHNQHLEGFRKRVTDAEKEADQDDNASKRSKIWRANPQQQQRKSSGQ